MMRSIIASTLFLYVTADNQAIKDALEDLQTNNTGLVRGLVKADMGMLDQYGCWCYFESDHGSGRGQPVDDVDKFCKTLHDGYSCIMMDSESWDDVCIPWEVEYESAIGAGGLNGMSIEELRSECEVKNGKNTCESMVCAVEGWFVQSFFLYSVSGGTLNPENVHENGFDSIESCPIKTGEYSEKECCGQYPERFPFKTQGGVRGCCGQRTYQSDIYSCCDDKVRMVC